MSAVSARSNLALRSMIMASDSVIGSPIATRPCWARVRPELTTSAMASATLQLDRDLDGAVELDDVGARRGCGRGAPAPAGGRRSRSSSPRGPPASTPARRCPSGRRSGTSTGRSPAGAAADLAPDSSMRSGPVMPSCSSPGHVGRDVLRPQVEELDVVSSSSIERSRLSFRCRYPASRIIVAAGSAKGPCWARRCGACALLAVPACDFLQELVHVFEPETAARA